MAGNVSLNTVTDGLVMYLDAANTKSLADVPSRNLLLWSQQFDNWSKYQSTVSTDTTTAPDGTSTADTNIETSGLTGWRGVSQQLNGVTSGGTYTFSIYAKNYNGRNIQMTMYDVPSYANFYVASFNLQLGVIISSYDIGNGVLTNSSIVSVGNGWYRCSISGYIPNTTQVLPYVMLVNSGNTTSYTGDGVSGVYLWGGQMELGNVATTYIPTTTAAASRVPAWTDISKGGNNGTLTSGFTYNYSNGGSLVFDGVNNIVNIGPGTNYAYPYHTYDIWVKTPGLGLSMSQCGLIAFDYGRYVTIDSTGNLRYTINWNGVTDVLFNAVTATNSLYDNKWHNVVCSRGTSLYTISIDGNLVVSGSNGGQPTWNGLNIWSSLTSRIGSNPNNNTYFLNGNISLVKVYNRQLSASEVLQNYNATKSRFGL